MSLITLKNDTNQKPWNWRNYFREPLIIPPKSSISLQNAVINQSADLNLEDNEFMFWRIGDNVLNPTYRGTTDLSVELWNAVDLAGDIKDELNSHSGQPAFCNNALNSSEGFDCFYNQNTKKFTITANQNPLPPEGECPQINPANPNYYLAQVNDGTWANFRRTQNVAGGALPSTVTTGALWGEAVIPRNAGHIIFNPSLNPATGQYPNQTLFGITSSNLQQSEISHFTSNPIAPFATGYFEIYGPEIGQQRCRVMLNEGALEDDFDVVTKSQGVLQLDPANEYYFAIEWVSPYSLDFKYSTDYDPADPAKDWENATWVSMYNMTTDPAGVAQIPTFQDNFCPIIYSYIRNVNIRVRGNFISDEAKCGLWSWTEEGFTRNDLNFELGFGINVGNDSFVGAYPNVYLRKEVVFVSDTADAGWTNAKAQEWENGLSTGLTDTEWGKILGFSGDTFTLTNDDATYKSYNKSSDNAIVLNKSLPTLHIQLTNFGIESKNGVVSNNVKDVAVIPLWNPNDDSDDTQLYYESQYENRINLNNLQELTLNQIDCMITTDDNTPAKFLDNFSTIILKIHKGLEDDERYGGQSKLGKGAQ